MTGIPALPEQNANPDDARHWRVIQSALAERIRRRYRALDALSPDNVDWKAVETALATAALPEELLRLLDQVDRRLDSAFARQSLRPRAAPERRDPGQSNTPEAFRC